MRRHVGKQRRTAIFGFAMIAAILIAVCVMPMLSPAAKTGATAASPTMSLTVVNNSSHDIRRLYFSPTNQDNWGSDQLGTTISPGGTHTVNNVSCSGGDIKAIAEDENGCFYYQVVQCGDSSTWTIANDAVPDCGTN